MTMIDIIQGISEIYREKRHEVEDLKECLNNVKSQLQKIVETKGENVTLQHYEYLLKREKELTMEITLKTQYYEGISCAREYLMDLGFDTEVE